MGHACTVTAVRCRHRTCADATAEQQATPSSGSKLHSGCCWGLRHCVDQPRPPPPHRPARPSPGDRCSATDKSHSPGPIFFSELQGAGARRGEGGSTHAASIAAPPLPRKHPPSPSCSLNSGSHFQGTHLRRCISSLPAASNTNTYTALCQMPRAWQTPRSSTPMEVHGSCSARPGVGSRLHRCK